MNEDKAAELGHIEAMYRCGIDIYAETDLKSFRRTIHSTSIGFARLRNKVMQKRSVTWALLNVATKNLIRVSALTPIKL